MGLTAANADARVPGTAARAFQSGAWWCARVWLILVAVFTLGRLFYLLDFREAMTRADWSSWELLRVFLLAWRFDGSAAVFLLAPALAAVVATALAGKWTRKMPPPRLVARAAALYLGVALALAWTLTVVDHYYFLYYQDHLNVFFWEFWDNAANAHLVIAGLGDEVRLPLALGVWAGGYVALLAAALTLIRRWREPRWLTAAGPARRTWLPVAWTALFLIAGRGTLSAQPLSLQDRRHSVSANPFINLLHTNPLFPLIRSYNDWQELANGRGNLGYPESDLAGDVALAAEITGNRLEQDKDSGAWFLSKAVAPAGSAWLKRPPRHIVVFFMESYSAWPMLHEDRDFARRISANMLDLKAESLSFGHHFPPAGGTMKNIANAIFPFPLPRGFHPALNYHREAYKRFPTVLPTAMTWAGYRPRFFYGGVSAWHRLYQFIPAIGFATFEAEHSFPGPGHHEHGLHDRDLFSGLATRLREAPDRTFNFVMSLSNHPPYLVPEGLDDRSWPVPATLKPWLNQGEEHFYKRFNAFRYSDQALGDFMRAARQEPWFADTLFVITADHAFGGTFAYPPAFGWREDNIPLLFYAPDLMLPHLKGTERATYTTHLDLLPTLVALTAPEPVAVHSWGRNLVADAGPEWTGINFYFSCLDGFCLRDGQVYAVDRATRLFAKVEDPDAADRLRRELARREQAYYHSGLHYLRRWGEAPAPPPRSH